eukprot:9439679-Karenia_brevis.AAC.1
MRKPKERQEFKKWDLYEHRPLSKGEKGGFMQQSKEEEERFFNEKGLQLGRNYKKTKSERLRVPPWRQGVPGKAKPLPG